MSCRFCQFERTAWSALRSKLSPAHTYMWAEGATGLPDFALVPNFVRISANLLVELCKLL
jgi:hypothetical protein